MTSLIAQDCLAWAADVPLAQGLSLYPRICSYVGYVKVGLSLFVEHGPEAVRSFQQLGGRVFLDLKLHDIPNTVERAAEGAARLGVSFLTVHAGGGRAMLEAAARGAQAGAKALGLVPPKVLAVTALTSLTDGDIASMGFGSSAASMADRLARLAEGTGVDGLVSSAREVRALRAAYPQLFLCTPGIRLEGEATQDQARAQTPAEAIGAGADLLVLGRSLYGAAQPEAVAEALAEQVAAALRSSVA